MFDFLHSRQIWRFTRFKPWQTLQSIIETGKYIFACIKICLEHRKSNMPLHYRTNQKLIHLTRNMYKRMFSEIKFYCYFLVYHKEQVLVRDFLQDLLTLVWSRKWRNNWEKLQIIILKSPVKIMKVCSCIYLTWYFFNEKSRGIVTFMVLLKLLFPSTLSLNITFPFLHGSSSYLRRNNHLDKIF